MFGLILIYLSALPGNVKSYLLIITKLGLLSFTTLRIIYCSQGITKNINYIPAAVG